MKSKYLIVAHHNCGNVGVVPANKKSLNEWISNFCNKTNGAEQFRKIEIFKHSPQKIYFKVDEYSNGRVGF